jgi:DNA polymerase-3 subunit beta
MTFTVNRAALEAELAVLQAVAEKKTTMPALEYVMLGLVDNVLTLTASSIDVSLITEIEAQGEAWSGCVPCKQLYQLVKLLTGETVTFDVGDNGVIIKAGRARHKLPLMKASEFPEIEQAEAEYVTLPAATFSEMLASVRFATLAPSDGIGPSQYRFTGVNLIVGGERLSLTATNITRLATVSRAVESSLELDVILPADSLSALATVKDGTVSVGLIGNLICFVNERRHFYIRRLHDDKFPDWQAMFPASYQHEAKISSAELGAAIKRAMVTQNEGRLVTLGLRWTWANDELLIETKGGDRGKSDELVAIECSSLNGSSVVLGMNGQQVVEALGLMGERVTCRFNPETFVVELTPPQSAINFTYYINTVSLRHWA